MKLITDLLYKLTPQLNKTNSLTLTKDTPYYKLLETLGQLSLSYEGEPSNKMKKMIGNLTGLLKKLSNGTEPKYLTPKELMEQLPTLTLSQLSTEILWLSNLYYWSHMSYSISRYSVDEGGWISIRDFNTYSECDEWLDHYCDIYDNSIVEINPTSQCIVPPLGWEHV